MEFPIYLIFWLLSFLKEFQNSEYEYEYFNFLALNTAELAAPQISPKNPRQRWQRRQRRVTDGKIFFALNSFFRYKKS
jgi:hypothetical protein